MSKKKPVLFTDLDDCVYPFLGTWEKWQNEEHNSPIDEALYWYYDIDSYLYNFIELQPNFIDAAKKINPLPISEAKLGLEELLDKYEIQALTARNKDHWYDHTIDWVHEHLPFITDIHFSRENAGSPAKPKGEIITKLKGVGLVDDTKHWIETLPKNTLGHIVKRPKPYASDEGAISWKEVVDSLKRASIALAA